MINFTMAELTLENGSCMDWQKRCLALESQLFKFRLQASKIRELLAEKMQELEQRVIEAEQRAEEAEKQVRVMEEKIKLANVKICESDSTLYRKYQDLMGTVQGKEDLISRLETQLAKQKQLRTEEAKIVQEKAAKIKEWVTFKLRELELENYHLKTCNQRLMEQIEALQDTLQDMTSIPPFESLWSCSSLKPRASQASFAEKIDQESVLLAPGFREMCQTGPTKHVLSSANTVLANDTFTENGEDKSLLSQNKLKLVSDPSSWNLYTEKDVFPTISFEHGLGCSDPVSVDPPAETTRILEALTFQSSLKENCSAVSTLKQVGFDGTRFSDDLSARFHSHHLESSSSGEIMSMVEGRLQTAEPPLAVSTSTVTAHSSCAGRECSLGTSMTFPKIRTPNTPRDSIQLAKRHHSQPHPGANSFHRVMHLETSTFQPITDPPVCPGLVEETDIDDDGVLEKMDTECGLLREEAGACEEMYHLPAGQREAVSSETGILDPGGKPPTPPLHRFPSWESRIYAVAKSGMRLSEVAMVNDTSRCFSNFSCSTSGPFTCLIYRNVTVPVYTTLKGKATQISNVPFLDESSGSDDDCGSHASLRTSTAGSENRKASMPGSPRAVKRGVSMSSLSSESDYAIPPDAYSLDDDYSEPEHKLQRTSSYSTDGGICTEPMEKSGYLLKMGSQVKMWKRRWFVLRNRQIMYYKSPSDVIRKPQGQMELNSSCQIVRGEGSQTFQLVTEKRTYFLTADSPNILEEWIHVLQSILRVQVTSPVGVPHSDEKPTVKGWLTKVKHGHSKLVWCALIGKTFYYYRNHEDKCPLGHLPMRESKVEEVDRSCDSDEDYEATGGGFLSSHCTLVIHPQDQSPTYLLIRTKQEKNTWLYHLTVAAGSRNATVGTSYEQLIGKLLDAEGDPNSPLWKHPMLCYSKDGLHTSLTTLPSEALQTEALKLFKSCQLFINVPVEASSVDYHVSLAQTALQVCLTHTELQNEIYCQLVKQTSCRQPQNHSVIQCWQLLALCAPLFLPQHHFLWYIKQHLQRHADPRSEIGKYAIYCQRSVDRTVQAGEREAKPSRMEIVSILLRNPYHHSLPFSIPVHFMNGTYQVIGFDGSSTVDEFIQRLNQETGMRKPSHMGFSLFTDDPSGRNLEHCLQGNMKICDVISKWEQALKELHPGKYEGGTRIVKLTYKNRLYFRSQAKGETDRERLLLAFQVSNEIANGRFPVNKELALEMVALMAQVEYGDLDRSGSSSPGGTSQLKMQHLLHQVLDKFYPKHYKQNITPEQLRQLTDRLAMKWMVLQGCSPPECIRIYLTVARKWPLFGTKIFAAKPILPSSLEDSPVWIAVNEDGISILDYNTMHLKVSYSYSSVLTFGGCRDDFMIVVSQTKENSSGKNSTEKLLFTMAVPKIVEATLLIASYINYRSSPSLLSSTQPSQSKTPAKKLWEIENRCFFPSMPRSTKGPTLL
ncbi:pleckstrin homology domain-containing family H member 1 [Corapipo altera]|uniref:pleckstrin homology domain-containing family H member 1 n=1 Tax=Corapipo altera TaxID=415028 RepID=UPI000FD6311C|nr:pleckstrin homology domain-containing family H member 1 [Corapipo altera]XP_027498061.1 pleckstrin homology domain-containing family H member 1 [Corapipo altera]XP_027498062.1 pleckstrin homology domain-containing family H member 1 [Corapipo altera]XP_027498063.1 pleckstrin homology domain-containing family H member 1 [Corapipo altera]XP_027498064.1 pleckstrin homology domain-containing family H member 1 [Corapipo altera]XP_027498065.1 pleckstrin homology domain-containing family H member 1